ncbi:leucine carboxyl methyltransferase 1 isoform X1 [Schistocerca gregaria]|uniref:leucine carboxyl methyltransferase 1 isoform X1 n=1 Tax=Schistocerca gregaria TaxID=7010 RepID=UPI00211EEDEF|nr:leucine carboxyl methyltransferase 1 isoform X1 [Schistocerca gregaria]
MSQPGCEAVQATNDDASECKRCAVKLGYWDDPYISLFVRGTERKAPEINRGYFARTKGVGIFIDKFLKKCGGKCQLINLGSGFDTLYWRLKDSGQTVSNFIELDFPTVTARKCYLIKRNKTLLEKIHTEDGEVKLSATDLHAGNYHIVGVDLTNLSEVQSKLNEAEVNYSLPTLFLAECVLVYVEVPRVEELLSWIAKDFSSALFVNYEQVNMADKFGEVMLSNLRSRGCLLAGVAMCQSLETQKKRFLNASWDGARAWDMVQIYSALPASERQRIERIEFLDEQELLTQLFQHYCIVIAWKGEIFSDIDIT